VSIDLSGYDVSCQADSDCISVSPGPFCGPRCLCGGAAINRSGEAAYQALIAPIHARPCKCQTFSVRCIQNVCVDCPFGSRTAPPGCTADGG
jgi:hypothetical protein